QPTVTARLHSTRHAGGECHGCRPEAGRRPPAVWLSQPEAGGRPPAAWLSLRPGGRAARHRRERRQACLVSHKILLISSLFPSSSSALAGSVLPLVPAAPASLVASLNSWFRLGYFSKCGGLK